jgi:hypothetical protein
MLMRINEMGNPLLREAVQQDLLNLPAGIQARYIHLTDRMVVYPEPWNAPYQSN